MPSRRRLQRVASGLILLALCAGCGSTVAPGAGGRAGDQLSLSGAAGGSQSSSAGGAVSGAGGGLSSGTASGGGSRGLGGGSGAISGGGSRGATTPGGTAGSGGTSIGGGASKLPVVNGKYVLHLGVVYLKGLDQAYKSASGGKSGTTDSQAAYNAVVKTLNAANPKLTIDASYYAVDASSTQSQADQLQAACAHFTQDTHANIVLSYSAGSQGALAACLQQRGVPLVDGSTGAAVGAGLLAQLPDLWSPSQLSLDDVGTLEASYLVRNHWVDSRWPSSARCAAVKQPRIGVLTFDRPDWRAAYQHATAPTFKSLGHPVYDVEFLSLSGSTAQQLAQASSAAQSAVLKFSSDCIDHVAFVGNVALDYLFMDVAQQQGFNPRYGLSSLEAPPVIAQNLTQPGAQLKGAMGPGWSPFADVEVSSFDAAAKAPAAACLAILRHANLAPTDNNSMLLALPACEGPTFATTVVNKWLAGGRKGSLLDAVNTLRSAYHPAGAYAADIRTGHHTGASSYRGFGFNGGCSCFRYTSGLQSIG